MLRERESWILAGSGPGEGKRRLLSRVRVRFCRPSTPPDALERLLASTCSSQDTRPPAPVSARSPPPTSRSSRPRSLDTPRRAHFAALSPRTARSARPPVEATLYRPDPASTARPADPVARLPRARPSTLSLAPPSSRLARTHRRARASASAPYSYPTHTLLPAPNYAVSQGGRRRRRCRWQDLPPHLVHHERFPRRVHPDRVRQLLGERHGRRQADQPRPVGHGRSGGLRPPAPAVVPPDGRLPHLLLDRQPAELRERPDEVVPRDLPPRAQHPHHPRRHEARPARGPRHDRQAAGEEDEPDRVPAGGGDGKGDWRGPVPRVLGADAEGPEERVRRGDPRRARTGAAGEEEVQGLRHLLDERPFLPPPPRPAQLAFLAIRPRLYRFPPPFALFSAMDSSSRHSSFHPLHSPTPASIVLFPPPFLHRVISLRHRPSPPPPPPRRPVLSVPSWPSFPLLSLLSCALSLFVCKRSSVLPFPSAPSRERARGRAGEPSQVELLPPASRSPDRGGREADV